jgi:DNA-binding response OmpR family regulator
MATCRVLAIDDDEAMAVVMYEVLRLDGYDCVVAGTGSKGLARAADTVPDVVLLDWGLPDLPAPEVIAQLRESGFRAPIVVVIAKPLKRSVPIHPEVAAYLAKPFHLEALVKLVVRYCPPPNASVP